MLLCAPYDCRPTCILVWVIISLLFEAKSYSLGYMYAFSFYWLSLIQALGLWEQLKGEQSRHKKIEKEGASSNCSLFLHVINTFSRTGYYQLTQTSATLSFVSIQIKDSRDSTVKKSIFS